MPLFDFKCRKCPRTRTDVFMHKAGCPIPCPSGKDHGAMERVPSAASFVVKGFNEKNGYGGYGQHKHEIKSKDKNVRTYVQSH